MTIHPPTDDTSIPITYPGGDEEVPEAVAPLAVELRRALGPVPPRSESRARANRAAFLTAGAELAAPPRASRRWHPSWLWIFRQAVAFALLLIVMLGGVRVTSASSLPGDELYPLKLGIEQVDALFWEPRRWEQHRQERRRTEVALLLQSGRVERVAFEGVLAETVQGQWYVGGVQVGLNAEQEQFALFSCPGSPTRLEGTVANGQLYLLELTPTCLQLAASSSQR